MQSRLLPKVDRFGVVVAERRGADCVGAGVPASEGSLTCSERLVMWLVGVALALPWSA